MNEFNKSEYLPPACDDSAGRLLSLPKTFVVCMGIAKASSKIPRIIIRQGRSNLPNERLF
jgi:hypothetical protein